MERHAILIGCEEYTHYNNISFCHDDVILMQEVLVKYCGYSSKNLLSEMIYPGSECSKPSEIIDRISNKILNSFEGDTILFFYAGHGLVHNKEAYLILPDSRSDSLPETALPLSKLNEILSRNGRSNFRIFDACHSGHDCRGIYNIDTELFNTMIFKEGWVTLASCSKDEQSYPYDEEGQGVFTYHLAECIKEYNEGEEIYIETLKIKICEKMASWCKNCYKMQTPTMNASISGNISIGKRTSFNLSNNENDNVTITTEVKVEVIVEEEMKNLIISDKTNELACIPIGENFVRLWESPNGIILPKKADISLILQYNKQLKQREVLQIIDSYNREFYEMTSEFVWQRAISILRKKVLSLGTEFVAEMVGINNTSFIENLPPFETINLALELGFIDELGKIKLRYCNELVQHYLSRDNDSEMSEDDVKAIIRPCIQYILGQDNSELKLEYNNFRDRLKHDLFEKDYLGLSMLQNSPYFYKRTTIRTLFNLLKNSEGSEFEIAVANMMTIIPHIWDTLLAEDRYSIGLNYAQYMNEGNDKYSRILKDILLKVKGFDYVPENLRSLSFIEAAKKLISVHNGINNFYNEPKAVKELESLGTSIPTPALGICIYATLAVKIGNAYGVSRNAQDYADRILDEIYSVKWKYYFDHYLIGEKNLLWDLLCNDGRVRRWCDIVSKYSLHTLEVNNSTIHKLLVDSVNRSYAAVCATAKNLYNRL